MNDVILCDTCKRNTQNKGNYFCDCTYYGYNRKTSVCERYIAKVDIDVKGSVKRGVVDRLSWAEKR